MAAKKRAKKAKADSGATGGQVDFGDGRKGTKVSGGMAPVDSPAGQPVLDKVIADRAALLKKLKLPDTTVLKKRVTERLRVLVTSAEKAALADQLAHVITQRLQLNEENATKNRAYREARAGFDEREKELADAVENNGRFDQVECIEAMLPDNSVRKYRLDTGEIVGEPRAATKEELQPDLFDDDDDDDVVPVGSTPPGPPESGDGTSLSPALAAAASDDDDDDDGEE